MQMRYDTISQFYVFGNNLEQIKSVTPETKDVFRNDALGYTLKFSGYDPASIMFVRITAAWARVTLLAALKLPLSPLPIIPRI